MMNIPEYVMQPGNPEDFIPQEQCQALKSAGLGYSIFKALGARKGLSSSSLKYIQSWCRKHCEVYHDVVPDERRLKKASFSERLFRPSQNALDNAICYPGATNKPSYLEMYELVWIVRKWPELYLAFKGEL